MAKREAQDWDRRYPVCGKGDGKCEYRVWRKWTVRSYELPLLLVFPPEPLRWALAVLQLLEDKSVAVPDPAVAWEPPWQREVDKALHLDPEGGLPADYWAEEAWMIRGREFRIPREWLKKSFDREELEVKVSDWLPAVCGYCSFVAPDPERYGCCRWLPLGSLRGTVYAPTDLRCPWRWQSVIEIDERAGSSEGAFCFVLAHEIAHAIGRMHYVVPAIMNWRGFLKNVLGVTPGQLVLPEDLPREFEFRNDTLDSRVPGLGTSEIDHLENLFGTRARDWHSGFQRWAESLETAES